MSWFAEAVFRSHPLSAFTTVCPEISDRIFVNRGDSVCFQRNFCSNFICNECHIHLPSFHDLLDHNDAAHSYARLDGVRTVAFVKPVHEYPANDHGHGALALPSSPASQSGCSSPSQDLQIAYAAQPSPIDDISLGPYKDTFRLDYFTACDVENFNPQFHLPVVRYPLLRYERDGTRFSSAPEPTPPTLPPPPHHHRTSAGTSDQMGVFPFSDDKRDSSIGPMRAKLRTLRARPQPLVDSGGVVKTQLGKVIPRAGAPAPTGKLDRGFTGSKKKKKVTAVSSSSSTRRNDLSLRCPTPGCIKVYRNPNGLRYHQQKGKCVIPNLTDVDVYEDQRHRHYRVLPVPAVCPAVTQNPRRSPGNEPRSLDIQVVDYCAEQSQRQIPPPPPPSGFSSWSAIPVSSPTPTSLPIQKRHSSVPIVHAVGSDDGSSSSSSEVGKEGKCVRTQCSSTSNRTSTRELLPVPFSSSRAPKTETSQSPSQSRSCSRSRSRSLSPLTILSLPSESSSRSASPSASPGVFPMELVGFPSSNSNSGSDLDPGTIPHHAFEVGGASSVRTISPRTVLTRINERRVRELELELEREREMDREEEAQVRMLIDGEEVGVALLSGFEAQCEPRLDARALLVEDVISDFDGSERGEGTLLLQI